MTLISCRDFYFYNFFSANVRRGSARAFATLKSQTEKFDETNRIRLSWKLVYILFEASAVNQQKPGVVKQTTFIKTIEFLLL
jgi:hypothetical protein